MIRNTTDFGGRFLVVKSMETTTTAVATTAAITTTAIAVAKTATATAVKAAASRSLRIADPKTRVVFVLRLL